MNKKLISDYEKLARSEFEKQFSKVKPIGKGFKGMGDFTQSLIDALKSSQTNTIKIANKFISNNQLTDEYLEETKRINTSLYEEFMKKFD